MRASKIQDVDEPFSVSSKSDWNGREGKANFKCSHCGRCFSYYISHMCCDKLGRIFFHLSMPKRLTDAK